MPATIAPTSTDALRNAQHVDAILHQVEQLPTLPAVATRLLRLTTDSQTHAREVVALISGDPTLTARVLSLARRLGRGIRDNVTTVERAVQLMGFNAIRNAVLSVSVVDLYSPDNASASAKHGETPADRFDLLAFWWHSLAVAVAAERLAHRHRADPDIQPDHAFVCGLLHDIGKLALHHVLPKAMGRVVELANLNLGNIAEFERRVLGIDHHTAGKRLAEQWGLPPIIQDCIWLHGSPGELLPDVPHRRMIGLVTLADLIVRRHHIGYSGNHDTRADPRTLAQELDLDPGSVEDVAGELHDRLTGFGEALGLKEMPTRELMLASIQQANAALGRLNETLERRGRASVRLTRLIEAVSSFHRRNVEGPAAAAEQVLEHVAGSALEALGPGLTCLLYESEPRRQWLFIKFNREGKPVRSEAFTPPRDAPALESIDAAEPADVQAMGLLPYLADYLGDDIDVRKVRLLPLGAASGGGATALLLHDRAQLPPWNELAALTLTWGSALATAREHRGIKRLGEQLAEANRALSQAQDDLLAAQSLARLGEMAAGAAHEMNNPLAVISGRSQLLAMKLQPGSEHQKAARIIVDQAQRLSDLISSMNLLAQPPVADRKMTDVKKLLEITVKQVNEQLTTALKQVPISLQFRHDLPDAPIDPQLISSAVYELLMNAMQATPASCVHLAARLDIDGRTLLIQVSDDGIGMDEHTLAHAMDPFFSHKPAGRRAGLGLTRVQQYAKAHGGTIDLRSTPRHGTVATLNIPLQSHPA